MQAHLSTPQTGSSTYFLLLLFSTFVTPLSHTYRFYRHYTRIQAQGFA